jgi:PAS domain-containing protein
MEQREVERLRRFYRHTFIPDESFFQTALVNSPLSGAIVNDSRRLIEWNPGVVTLTEQHRDLMLESDAWFARKFDERLDGRILDFLERRLADRPPPRGT